VLVTLPLLPHLLQCGRLLGCDWLLSLRLALWEKADSDGTVHLALARGYQTDVDSLANLATTRTAVLPRVSRTGVSLCEVFAVNYSED